ncbi:MAG TPA: LPS assembly protein LptD [Sulfurovum sp.]|nr:MAG: organic solvent tolerance protein [Sulfurovum sp. 35-42-20]OYZ25479.1 MAG: organic solvent tolerance protein [Sulfurovum sp. 16-42-52]OYZ48257.1 MAG: organic solvent tolerance protein [Sulfurovum sp. 24-42-9]OZA44643.1 MAG: organic solvent tolerance protein [Sulfurovum sp. 17-42-90]OZA59335.1 MAG: organic solvent tolerance protein [Sulfurovum sp. 39-42-12]HQR73586.1 LPS assembly protein LptD [Sulfurovum sp.]
MAKRFFLASIFCFIQMLCAATENNKIEITAKHLESTKTTVDAKENVLVYYQDTIIRANTAHYDKTKKLLVLDGKIEMIGYQGSKEHSNHMEIYTDTDEVTFDELFLVSKQDVWLYSDDVHKKEGNYTLGTSMLSSCDTTDPLWKMFFERSEYDSQAHFMKVYDAKVYLWDMPMFYTPYMSFSTNKQRSSGLLFPAFGYRSSEGLLYEQPVYWAISPSMDLELNPQIRTARSTGLYGTFRFVDSAYSSGQIRTGYFKDKVSYSEANPLINDSHYGLELNYESSRVLSHLSDFDFTDGIYLNTMLLNDIDYLNMQSNNLNQFGLTPLQESKFNYFTNSNDYYTGINAKYYIDTRKENNDDTLQVLPSARFHKYLNHFIWDNLTYSTDFEINNFDRKEGATLKQAALKIPLEFTTSFFDDYVNIALGEEFYYSKFFFGNGEFVHDDFEYYSNIHKVKLFTDLTKKYEGFIHVMQPSFVYLRPGNEQQSPLEFSSLDEEQKELFTVGLPEEQYNARLGQYFYDENMNLKFFQRLIQKYYLNRQYKLADTANEMQYNWNKWSLYNNITYAHEFSKIRDTSTRISYHETEYSLSAGYTYKEALPDFINTISANDIDLRGSYMYNKKITLLGGFTYNIDEEESKQWYAGGSYNRECWSVVTSIRQDIVPRPTGFTTDYTFYMQLNFIPFGSIGTGEPQL